MKQTALVAGGAGYIGNHVVYELLADGWEVVILDDLSTGQQAAVLSNAIFCQGDIGDAPLVRRIIGEHNITVLFHLAAISSVPASVADPKRCYAVNVLGSRTLIDTAVECGIKNIVFSSTSVVYDERNPAPYDEDAALHPISPYAETKLETERYLSAQDSINSVILRFFNVGGAQPNLQAGNYKENDTTLIKVALEVAIGKREFLPIFGTDYPTPDGTCVRDYVHVCDVAHANLAAIRYLLDGGMTDIFNIGVGRGYSVCEVVDVAKNITGINFKTINQPRREGDPVTIYCKPDKAAAILNFRTQQSNLTQIVEDAWRWERYLRK